MKALYTFLLFVFASVLGSQCIAAQHRDFSLKHTKAHLPVHGQIDWPGGKIDSFRGQVVVLISAGGSADRDGWLLRALDTVWWNRSPLKEMSDALVKKGFAVVRFDSPGVRPPASKCREAITRGRLSAMLVATQCVDVDIAEQVSVPKYIDSIEQVLKHVQELTPRAQAGFILFGFSEGFWHAASIADRGHVAVRALVALGAGVESLQSLTRWQLTDRAIETLPEFDRDKNGEISNEEIRKGYSEGVRNITSDVRDWISPSGTWNDNNVAEFGQWLRKGYEDVVLASRPYEETGGLQWKALGAGVLVPDITDSFQDYHVLDSRRPLDIIIQRRIPTLFFWGEQDRQVRVQHQRKLIKDAEKIIPYVKSYSYSDRHHLLSRRKDTDWFETAFAAEISGHIQEFMYAMRPFQKKILESNTLQSHQ